MRYSVPGRARLFCVLAFLPLAVLARTEVYVPLGSANAVAVVDTDEDQVIAEILGVPASHGLAVSWDGRFLVAGSLAERPEGVLPPKPGVMSVDEHAAHHEVGTPYVPDPAEKSKSVGSVYLIDAEARRLLRQIDVPGGVHHVLVTPDGKYAVATHPGRGSVSVIDIPGHQFHKELPTGPAPNYAVSKRDGTRVYVSNTGNGTISEIDTASWAVLRNLPASKSPAHIVLSPDERFIYAVDPAAGVVSRVDLAQGKVTESYPVGRDSHGVDLSDDGRLLYASSKGDNRLVVHNLASGERRNVALDPAPYHVTTVRGTGKLYVSSRQSPQIWVLEQQSLAVLGSIPIQGEGHEMGVMNR